ncbi:hypothetical protein KJ909_02705 [Patescibacteria group bacterium]|nr:hypothetical protein [Patescibacteria group bacterium]
MPIENPESLRRVVLRVQKQFPGVEPDDDLQRLIEDGGITRARLFQELVDEKGKGKSHISGKKLGDMKVLSHGRSGRYRKK